MLADIPPLSRSEIQANGEDLLARFPGKRAMRPVWATTSGSTGTPVRVEHLQRVYGPVYLAVTLLLQPWYGFDASRPMATLRRKLSDADHIGMAPPFSWLGPTALGFHVSTYDREVSELHEHCAKRDPAYLACGPGVALELARYGIATGCRRLRPDMVLSIGWAVSEDMREVIREGLGAKVIDRYSCEETGYIAMQCPSHNHLHVISPMTLVEIVDEHGRYCPPGKPGRVLLTGMQSYGMPLIRYDVGDVAEWGEACDCGIALPVIKQIWGRSRHLLTHPDGRQTFVRIYARDLEKIPGLQQYRFVLHQGAMLDAQLKVSADAPRVDNLVVELLQRAVGYPYPVQVRYVEMVDWGSDWKQENFAVSDLPAAPLAEQKH